MAPGLVQAVLRRRWRRRSLESGGVGLPSPQRGRPWRVAALEQRRGGLFIVRRGSGSAVPSSPSMSSMLEEEGTQQLGGLDLASPSWGAALEVGGQERRQGRFIVRRRPAGGVPGRREWRRRRGGHGGRRSGGSRGAAARANGGRKWGGIEEKRLSGLGFRLRGVCLVGRTVRMDDVQVWMRAACFHVHVSTRVQLVPRACVRVSWSSVLPSNTLIRLLLA
jgi:hypothetical protein